MVSSVERSNFFCQGCQTSHCYKPMQAVQGIDSQLEADSPPPLKISFPESAKIRLFFITNLLLTQPFGAAVDSASCLSFFSKMRSICSTGMRLLLILRRVPTILRICLYKKPFPEKVKVKNCPVSSTIKLASLWWCEPLSLYTQSQRL